MCLAKYYMDVYLDIFGLNSLRIYSSVIFERHISKKHRLVLKFLDLNFPWFKMVCNRTSRAMMAGGL